MNKYYIHTAHYDYDEGCWKWWADHPYHITMQAAKKQMEYLQSLYPWKKFCIFTKPYNGLFKV